MEKDNLECFFAEYKNKYPKLKKGVYVHQWPDKSQVVGNMSGEQVRYVFENHSMTSINDDGVSMLQKCDGTKTLQQVIDDLVAVYGNEEQVRKAVATFLYRAREHYGNIEFYPEQSEKVELEITGTKEYYTPMHFSMEITTRCNLLCKHCYRSATNEIKEQELTYDEIIAILSDMYDSGARFVELTGGELFMHPDIKKILKYVSERFYFIGILTNGVLIDDNMINYLDQYKEKFIWSISLDSYKEEYHNEFRGSKTAYRKTVHAIKTLIEHGHNVRVSMTVTQDNIDDVEKSIEFARNKLKATWFGYNYIMPYGRGSELKWTMDSKDLEKRMNKITEYSELYPQFLNVFGKDVMQKIIDSERNCGSGWRTVCISSSGVVRPCVIMDEDYIKLGNLKTEKIYDIMKKPIVQKLHDLKWPLVEDCGHCQNKEFCMFCPYRAFITNNERLSQGLDLCKWAKNNGIEEFVDFNPDNVGKIDYCLFKNKCSIGD